MDTLQFQVLPFGLLFALAAVGWLGRLAGRTHSRREAAWLALLGLTGGVALLAVMLQARLVPTVSACLNCGFMDRWWYSLVLTFMQGFGWTCAWAWMTRRIRQRRTATTRSGTDAHDRSTSHSKQAP